MDPWNQCSWNNPIRRVRGLLFTHQPFWSCVLVCWPPDWGDTGTARHTSPRAPSQTNSRGNPAYTGRVDTGINAHYVYSSPNTWNIYYTETLFQPKQDRKGCCYKSPESIFVDNVGGIYFLLHDLVLLEVPNNPLTTSLSHKHTQAYTWHTQNTRTRQAHARARSQTHAQAHTIAHAHKHTKKTLLFLLLELCCNWS